MLDQSGSEDGVREMKKRRQPCWISEDGVRDEEEEAAAMLN